MKRSYTDSETQAILARAIEIDAQSPTGLEPEQLKSIAAELGISPTALDKAINEHGGRAVVATANVETPARDFAGARRLVFIAVLVAAIIAMGAIGFFAVFRSTPVPPLPPRVQPTPAPLPGKANPPPRIIPADQAGPRPKKTSNPNPPPPPSHPDR